MVSLSEATDYVLSKVDEKANKGKPISILEIGSGSGDTSLQIVSKLGPDDSFYFMDYYSKVRPLREKLSTFNVKINGIGNGKSYYDSYAWNLAELYTKLKEIAVSTRIFDLVFLDASNIFIHDCAACSILKNMIAKEGIIIINNTNWCFSKSKYWNPQNNDETLKLMSEKQTKKSQTDMVCKVLFDDDFEFFSEHEGNNFKAYKFIGYKRKS